MTLVLFNQLYNLITHENYLSVSIIPNFLQNYVKVFKCNERGFGVIVKLMKFPDQRLVMFELIIF